MSNSTGNGLLITGAAGFIGSHVAERLADSGRNLILVDNFDSFLYEKTIKERNISEVMKYPNVELLIIDLRNSKELERIFRDREFSQIVHLAARAGVRPSKEYPLEYEDFNIRTTLNLLELCRKYDVGHFIFGSSSSVYGGRSQIPFSENDQTDFPISPYGASKKAGEVYCYTYSHLYSISVTCLRFFTVYGPRQRPEMAIHLFTRLIDENKSIPMFGDGTSKRDYTYILDIVDGVVAVIKNQFNFEIFNLGNSEPIELRYLISLIEKELNKKAQIKRLPESPGDPKITWANIEKAKQMLGYTPKVKIEDGIRLFVDWYRKSKGNSTTKPRR